MTCVYLHSHIETNITHTSVCTERGGGEEKEGKGGKGEKREVVDYLGQQGDKINPIY